MISGLCFVMTPGDKSVFPAAEKENPALHHTGF